jgi:hypothetical protein
MECPAVLGSEEVYALGAAVTRPMPSADEPEPPIGLPLSRLLSPACRVPGTELDITPPARSRVVVPDITFTVDKSLVGKGVFAIPALGNITISPGGNAGKLSSIKLHVREAWTSLLDENEVIQAVSSCAIKLSCIDQIRLEKYSIINNVIVGQGVEYQFLDSTNKEVSIGTALQSDVIKIEGQDTASNGLQQQSSLSSSTPLVLAISFLPPDALQQRTLCQEAVVVHASGTSTVTVTGGGGKGNIGSPPSVSAEIGKRAEIQRQGSESSECRADFERIISEGRATAVVSAPTASSLDFDDTAFARGGHYATAAGCVAGNVIGKTGHDNTTLTTVRMTGTVRATVRGDYAKMAVIWNGLPSGTLLRVTGPNGETLRPVNPEKGDTLQTGQANGTFMLPVAGNAAFSANGPGVYLVDVTVETAQNATGAGTKEQSIKGHLAVSF